MRVCEPRVSGSWALENDVPAIGLNSEALTVAPSSCRDAVAEVGMATLTSLTMNWVGGVAIV